MMLMPFTVIGIAAMDYMLFHRWVSCEKCGARADKDAWLLACTLETFFFVCGLFVGVML